MRPPLARQPCPERSPGSRLCRRWALELGPLFLLAVAAACSTVVDPPVPEARIPLVEALLIAGDAEATVRIRWAAAGNDQTEPVGPVDVALLLQADPGPHAPLISGDSAAGLYHAAIPIVAGAAYHLTGTVAGRPISARTVIPASLTIAAPTGAIAPATPDQRFEFRWRSVGATVYATDHGFFPKTLGSHTRDTIGEFIVVPATPPRPRELTIYAMNADAERYLFFVAGVQSNVTGGIGVLAGAVAARRPIQWP